MGLLDSILGGGNDAGGAQSSLLGNKKVLFAVAVLAYLAMKHKSQGAGDAAAPQGQEEQGGLFGSLGGLLGAAGGAGALGSLLGGAGGGLGGLLGGLLGGGSGNADQAAAGGLGPLQQILEQAGLGEQVKSWIGNGQNLPVSGEQITQALSGTGALEEVSKLAAHFGINEGDLANQLAEGLPEAVNHLTPQGAVPAA
ncbi:YidB family protein [Ralstonia wenshanensis]|uniref:YidB family protein n=1 Tax=Ralstonia wenshanensis TaxID=2842456 RepID=UPI0039C5BB43